MTKITEKKTKNIGVGSLFFALCLIGILFAFRFGNKFCIGDIILNNIGLSAWSNGDSGTHYTTFYSLYFSSLPLLLVIFILIIKAQKQGK